MESQGMVSKRKTPFETFVHALRVLTYITLSIISLFGCFAFLYPTVRRSLEIHWKQRCQEVQLKIEEAKLKWAADKQAPPEAVPTWDDLIGGGYLKKSPTCGAGGTYSINAMDAYVYCTLSDQAKFPHVFPQETKQ